MTIIQIGNCGVSITAYAQAYSAGRCYRLATIRDRGRRRTWTAAGPRSAAPRTPASLLRHGRRRVSAPIWPLTPFNTLSRENTMVTARLSVALPPRRDVSEGPNQEGYGGTG